MKDEAVDTGDYLERKSSKCGHLSDNRCKTCGRNNSNNEVELGNSVQSRMQKETVEERLPVGPTR